jgi:2-keto-4-pentenoate hydratase/2-oxohepta-3-ene-1,7-dioic acid hydratase in catechol pathway
MSTDAQVHLAMVEGPQGTIPAIFGATSPNDLIDLRAAAAYFAGAGIRGDHAPLRQIRDIGALIDAGFDRDLLAEYVARRSALPPEALIAGGGSDVIGTSPRLRAPIHPRQMPCIGMNRGDLFQPGEKRSAGKMPQIREAPSYAPFWWLKAVTSVTGPHQPIIHPGDAITTFLIPEPEFGVVIGRRLGPGVASPKARDALSYIAGYLIMNEVSALDIEFERGGDPFAYNLAWSKSYPTFAPIGPAIAVAGDIDHDNLAVTMRINGEVKLQASTADHLWSPAELIEYFGAVCVLEPGDIIACGNLAGANTIRPGDLTEITFERIGLLSNPMVATDEVRTFAIPRRATDYAESHARRAAAATARG